MSQIAAHVLRPFGKIRPTVGLRTCLATLALFSVAVWYFSPAAPSPLPPRSRVERVVGLNFHGADASPWLGHMQAELPASSVDRLYEAMRESTLTNDLLPDPEDLSVVMSLRVYTDDGSRHLLILASRKHGSRIEAYDDDQGLFGIFRMMPNPAAVDAFQAIGEAAEEVHRRSMSNGT